MFSLVVAGGSVTMYLCDKWIAREKESEILQERENRNFLKKQMHELAAYANRLSQGKFNVLSMSPDEICKFCHDMIIRKKKELESRIKELEREINDMRPVIAVCREKVDKDTVERLKSILKKGGDINEVDDEYRSPLHWACENNSIELVKILVEAGADVNAREKNGDTPLITAVRKGRTKSRSEFRALRGSSRRKPGDVQIPHLHRRKCQCGSLFIPFLDTSPRCGKQRSCFCN